MVGFEVEPVLNAGEEVEHEVEFVVSGSEIIASGAGGGGPGGINDRRRCDLGEEGAIAVDYVGVEALEDVKGERGGVC